MSHHKQKRPDSVKYERDKRENAKHQQCVLFLSTHLSLRQLLLVNLLDLGAVGQQVA